MSTGTAGPPPSNFPQASTTGLVMGYYDGNTVTALWNYAQHYSMSDNSYDTNFGPSTPGAINVVSGQTNGVINNTNGTGALIEDGSGGLTDISDADPAGDICSTTTGEVFSMSGKNIGDLLNAAGVTWGFFEGGFDLTVDQPERNHWMRAQHHFADHQHEEGRLHSRITSRSNTTSPPRIRRTRGPLRSP